MPDPFMTQEPKQTITSIEGAEPMREGEFATFVAVGHNGVTRIEKRNAFRGDYSVFWFDVYGGDILFASMNERHVARVTYEAQ